MVFMKIYEVYLFYAVMYNPAKTDIAKQHSKQTCLEKYGVENFVCTEQYKIQSEQTSLKKYGVKHYAQTDKARKATSLHVNTRHYNKIASANNEVEPLFTLEEYCKKTPLTQFKWRCKKCGSEFVGPVTFIWANQGGNFARCTKCHPIRHVKSKKQLEVFEFI